MRNAADWFAPIPPTTHARHKKLPEGIGKEVKGFFSLHAHEKTSLSLVEQNKVYRSLPQPIQVQVNHESKLE